MPDRRTNPKSRDRIDELGERVDARLDQLAERSRKVANSLIAGAVIIVMSWVLAFWGLESQQAAIQQSRVEAIAATCEATNREHRAIRRFVSTRARSRAARREVQAAFPIVKSCVGYAKRVAEPE